MSYPLIGSVGYGSNTEAVENSFQGYTAGAYKQNGVVFATVLARILLFSEARFQWQRISNGRPTDLFGTADLSVLENPWPNGTTGELLARMEQDVSLAGNFFAVRETSRIRRLRPDWVEIILSVPPDEAVQSDVVAYRYVPGGVAVGEGELFLPEQVCHWSPIPDPVAQYRGMSWITPVMRELQADGAATTHKLKFFENAAPQPLDAKILTPSGWSTMGEMSVGARVIGSDGDAHRVTGVYPKGEREIFRVRFADGGSVECTDDHLWTVANSYDRKRGVRRTLPLKALVEGDGRFGSGAGRGGLLMPSGGAKWAVPMVGPIDFDEQAPVPVDPYLLGLLLGDGSFRGNGRGDGQYGNVTLAAAQEDSDEIAETLRAALPGDVSFSRRDRGSWSEFYFTGPAGPFPGSLKEAVRSLGLWGKGSREKFVPRQYLAAAVKDRIALLQGLIDSDGSIDARQPSLVTYTTNSVRLAADVVELTQGLGGLSRMAQHGGRDRWTITVKRLPDGIVPARLLRKASRYRQSQAPRWRAIVGVEPVGVKQAQCIKVDVEDHLYVTDDYVLTHNTPNLAVSMKEAMTPAKFNEFVDAMDSAHKGVGNAYKTLYTANGADVSVVGADMRQLDFKQTQGAGETRICAAGGVPPIIVGLSEGLQASTYSNYGMARRKFGDHWARPQWRSACAALASLVKQPGTGGSGSVRLWYDDRDIAFLREDESDRAAILKEQMLTIEAAVRAGFEPDSAKAAVVSGELMTMTHTGLYSVQLQPPGTAAAPSASPAPAAAPSGNNQDGGNGNPA